MGSIPFLTNIIFNISVVLLSLMNLIYKLLLEFIFYNPNLSRLCYKQLRDFSLNWFVKILGWVLFKNYRIRDPSIGDG